MPRGIIYSRCICYHILLQLQGIVLPFFQGFFLFVSQCLSDDDVSSSCKSKLIGQQLL